MSKSVLVIEDNYQTQKILRTALKKEGYKVLSATMGAEGVEVAKATSPNLILLDIMLLGDYDGLEVLQQIKKEDSLSNTPIIVLTNLDNEEEAAKSLGANDYLVKANISVHEIIDKVNKHIN